MKYIYIVVSETRSIPSRVIHFFTRDRYTHVTVSLNHDLTEMYTFGRKYLYSIYPGGYIKERILERMYKRFKKTRMVVLRVKTDEDNYAAIATKLRNMYDRRSEYKYNYLGVFLALFNKSKKRKNYYYCSEFVWELLKEFDLISSESKKEAMRPFNFLELDIGEKIYEGFMREYPILKQV